jgi:cyclophilin family peptidyl-prolyl cis-trans isomerase
MCRPRFAIGELAPKPLNAARGPVLKSRAASVFPQPFRTRSMSPYFAWLNRIANRSRPGTHARKLPARRRKQLSGRGLEFETFEPRRTLAGNVLASLSNGNLLLAGDDESNSVEVVIRDSQVVVVGLSNTTVNGQASVIVSSTTSLNGRLAAYMAFGDDRVAIRAGVGLPDSVLIELGEGNNAFGMTGVTVTRDVYVGGGSDVDDIALASSTVGGGTVFSTGGGNDTISLQNMTLRGHLAIHTGKNEDGIELRDTTISGFLNLDTGKGNDTVSLADTVFSGAADVLLGRGDDVIRVEDATAAARMRVRGKSGDDALQFTGTGAAPAGFEFAGGRGDNSFNGAAATAANDRGAIRGAGAGNFDAAAFTARFNDPTTGLTARLATARLILVPTNVPTLTLTAAFQPSLLLQSSGIQVTGTENLPISGTTTAGTTVELARDGDGLFNDGSVVADANGNYTVAASLLNNFDNEGENSIIVRARDIAGNTLTQTLRVYFAEGSVVRMATDRGNIDIDLFDTAAPLTVANFKTYFARYTNSIVHRSISAATDGLDVIQGGGFTVSGNTVSAVTTSAPVTSGNANSGTSQWFFNLDDHATLDTQRFTVFGRIIGTGLDVADAINALTEFDLADFTSQTALTDVPLENYVPFSTLLPGSVAVTSGSNVLTGTGTSFTQIDALDNRIRIGDQEFVISSVISDTEIRLATNSTVTTSGAIARVNPEPTNENFVVLSSVSELTLPD